MQKAGGLPAGLCRIAQKALALGEAEAQSIM
jgi:hypothetical protein